MRIALLTYRASRYTGGQGVYVRELSRALVELGHSVEVFSGPPYPELDPRVRLTEVPSLELYRPEEPFVPVRPIRDWIDRLEISMLRVGRYPEPLTFSLRCRRLLSARRAEFDVVHDNQGLGYGLLGVQRFLPVVATVHHPIDVDLKLNLETTSGFWPRYGLRTLYGFVRMQARVARRLPRLITVSEASREDCVREMGVAPSRVAVVPLGVDTSMFSPPSEPRAAAQLVCTASSDVVNKGVAVLLEALAALPATVSLTVVGPSREGGPTRALCTRLGLDDRVTFVSGLEVSELAALYRSAALVVVPSLHEGFCLPALEAMACGTPMVTTTAGALPELVQGCAVMVPPGDPGALARAIQDLLADAPLRERLAEAGRARALREYTWSRTAARTAEAYILNGVQNQGSGETE